MDGLLVDSEPEWFESEKEVTARYGYEWTLQDQIHCLGGPLSRVGQYMFMKCDQVNSPEQFTQDLIDSQVNRMQTQTPLMPGALKIVRELQDNAIKTGLVSASPRIIVDAVLSNLGRDLFPFSISSDDVLNTKPHPDAYVKAAAMSGVDINNCLIFEDSLTGMNAAIASGAWLIAVPHLVTIQEGARIRRISSLEQISFNTLQSLSQDFSSPI